MLIKYVQYYILIKPLHPLMQIIMIHSAQLNAFNLHNSMILIEQVVPHTHAHTHTHTLEVDYGRLRNSENSLLCLFDE
jgi:hypothetical protein